MSKGFRKLLLSAFDQHYCVCVRRASIQSTTKELKEELERLRVEAKEKGFARRDSPQDVDLLLNSTKNAVEKLPGSDVLVAHLPPKKKEITPFDEYKRSTTQFTSLVAPYGVSGIGLGAGFGALPDNRLGFLRPRQTLQPRGSSESVEPKFDENGMPINLTLSKAELLQRRKEYLKSFEGTTMSPREHFLLVDLDFDKDAVLFGNTREEFERNVKIMRKVIVGYQRWERSDNFYYYSTIVLKIFTIWVLIECLHQYYELQLLATQYSTFAEGIEKEVAALRMRRSEDLQNVTEELRLRPPNFKPTMKAIQEEKQRFVGLRKKGEKSETEYSSSSFALTNKNEEKVHTDTSKSSSRSTETSSLSSISPSTRGMHSSSSEAQKSIPFQEFYQKHIDHHPMDTTGESAAQQQVKDKLREHEMKQFHREVEMLEKEKETQSILFFFKKKMVEEWHALRCYWNCFSLSLVYLPLSAEDLSRFSYAASPTSVESVRRIRRILLPRSEDFTQVVREEMVAYEKGKKRKL